MTILEKTQVDTDQSAAESACSADELLLCCDEVDDAIINRWFDYWELQEERNQSRRPYWDKAETINKIRRVALAGASKARRNNKAISVLPVCGQ